LDNGRNSKNELLDESITHTLVQWSISPQGCTVERGKSGDGMIFDTLKVSKEHGVLFVDIAAPPMNLLGPELVRDLVSLIKQAEADDTAHVLVFRSADPDYFLAHVDVTRIAAYRAEATTLVGEPSVGLLLRYLSASRLVSIAQIAGRARGIGSEFVLACDMRFAARESAIFAQFEGGFGLVPGGGGMQHLTRLAGRGRALEILLSADDFNADLAERYGWINRALPAAELGDFVAALAWRIARFPSAALVTAKRRVNAIALAPIEDFRRDSDLFLEHAGRPESQARTQAAMKLGFQTREAELDLGAKLGTL
jgi:enoyl-CoA hydratase/carnithine racemase